MKFLLPAIFSLCLLSCIDEYSDSIVLQSDGSATFFASIYPCEPDSNLFSSIRVDYDSVPGVSFDSAWFVQRDSAYALNFKVSFENLLAWKGNEKIEKDFVGAISLKKIDSLKNRYSFERVINGGAEGEDGSVVPEENISGLILDQIIKNDSTFWEYSVVLPTGSTLLNVEPIDAVFKSDNPNAINWKIPAGDAISKRISLKADFSLPSQKTDIASFIGITAGCLFMLLAIYMLIRKLKRLSIALKDLKDAEKNIKE
jgi:hypothetical protein